MKCVQGSKAADPMAMLCERISYKLNILREKCCVSVCIACPNGKHIREVFAEQREKFTAIAIENAQRREHMNMEHRGCKEKPKGEVSELE